MEMTQCNVPGPLFSAGAFKLEQRLTESRLTLIPLSFCHNPRYAKNILCLRIHCSRGHPCLGKYTKVTPYNLT